MSSKPYQQKSTLRELYWGEEMSSEEMANELGVSKQTILNWMDKRGVERRSPRHQREHADKTTPDELKNPGALERWYLEERMSTAEIADMVDTTAQTVLNWIDRHGIETRSQAEGRCKYPELMDESWLREQHDRQGRSQHEIADEFGCHPMVVNQWMKRHGIDGRTERGPNSGGELIEGDGPNWEEQRELRIQMDNGVCQDCDADSGPNGISLDVHHTNPRGDFTDENGEVDWGEANAVDNLVTLCRKCHLRRHAE